MIVKFIFYGKFKSGGVLNFLIPKRNSVKKKLKLKGYRMYKFGNSVGVIQTKQKDYVECELWELDISRVKLKLLLLILDLVEGVYYKKYKRIIVDSVYGSAWIYIYNRKISLRSSIEIKNFVIKE
jgi:gamma-glutamylcyclotransferase (GGCT)/AIG2-like uncharacterized protein YtfP